MYFVQEKLTQRHHITTQPNQSGSIAGHFQIRFRRMITKNLIMKNITFLQLSFSLTDINNYIPTHFGWKYSGYCISEQSLISSAVYHASSNWSVAFNFSIFLPLMHHEINKLKTICFCIM